MPNEDVHQIRVLVRNPLVNPLPWQGSSGDDQADEGDEQQRQQQPLPLEGLLLLLTTSVGLLACDVSGLGREMSGGSELSPSHTFVFNYNQRADEAS